MRLQDHRQDLQRVFLSGLSGLLLTLAFPKAGLDVLAWVALVPFLYTLREGGRRERLISGLSFGLVHYLSLLYWVVYTLNTYGYIPLVLCVPIVLLLSLYLSLYPCLFAWVVGRPGIKPLVLILLAPALWVCLEYVRAWALTGFPWELLGYSQHRVLPMIQIADLFGVYGVSFLIVLVNTAIFTACLFFSKKTWNGGMLSGKTVLIHGSAALVCVALTWTYGSLRIRQIDRLAAGAGTASVSVIQGNIDQSMKWNTSYQHETLFKYRQLSMQAAEARPDLIVWPETSAPFYFGNDKSLSSLVRQTIETCGTEFLIGFPSYEQDMDRFRFFNSAHLFDPRGEITGSYSKVHLVPFGEYVPLQKFLPFIQKLTAQSGDFFPGEKGSILWFGKGGAGVQICFEVIFPGLSRAMVKNGAKLLVNITNDAWFGTSSAPYQHFSMVKFRAVENKRAVARAANTGISGFIDPVGRVVAQTGLYEDRQLTRSLPLADTLTFYTRYGDVFLLFCLPMLIPAVLSFRASGKGSKAGKHSK